MPGLLFERLRCFWRGHTYGVKFRRGRHGYECVDCCRWKASPFGD